MYTNTTYNHMYYEQCTVNIALFAKPKYLPICITSQFTKLIVHQRYHLYSNNDHINAHININRVDHSITSDH